jgi:hypothetical protein
MTTHSRFPPGTHVTNRFGGGPYGRPATVIKTYENNEVKVKLANGRIEVVPARYLTKREPPPHLLGQHQHHNTRSTAQKISDKARAVCVKTGRCAYFAGATVPFVAGMVPAGLLGALPLLGRYGDLVYEKIPGVADARFKRKVFRRANMLRQATSRAEQQVHRDKLYSYRNRSVGQGLDKENIDRLIRGEKLQ